MHILGLEVGDSYQNRSKSKSKWNRLSRYAEQNRLNGNYGRFVSVSLDDPLITPTGKCRFYWGVTIPAGTKPDAKSCILQIPKGRYAVFRHTGNYVSLHKLYRAIYEEWLPLSKYRPKGTMTFELYLNSPGTTKVPELVTEVYIPIEKK
jgi:DNA gyrase inhibitor GyrI